MNPCTKSKILILCPCPLGISPGQRFRFEQYLNTLRDNGLVVDVQAFLDMDTMRILYQQGHMLEKVWGVIKGFLRRLWILTQVYGYDYIFIYREATPLGPPFIEAILFLFSRRVIYDFDDAIYISKTSTANRIVSFFKWNSKIRFIARHSLQVTVCNNYLVHWASRFNKNVLLLPTTIDLDYHKPNTKAPLANRNIVIGWTGTRSTMVYLELVRESLKELQEDFDFEFRVICDIDPKFPELRNYRFFKWNLATEIEDLAGIDIGIMPVPQGEWEQGKVGFKAIQYSGVSAAPVVSSTGSGHEVVVHGKTGLVVQNNKQAWLNALSSLLKHSDQIEEMGKAARQYVDERYSVRSQRSNYLSLFCR